MPRAHWHFRQNFLSTTIHPYPRMSWVSKEAELQGVYKIFGLVRCFSLKIEKSLKDLKTVQKLTVFQDIFWLFSILTEKQHTKPKILESPCNFASFDTHNILRHGWIVEISLILGDFCEFSNGGATWWVFVMFKIKPSVSITISLMKYS